jgi:D-arabinose 1-dehydrogenase-like Zn-dependent alcohol dehydrogenase
VKALVLEAVQKMSIQDLPDPRPSTNGAVIRVRANGVCRSDWHAWTGHQYRDYPFVLGHELAGVVEEIGQDVTGFAVGDRVVVPFAGSDGTCHWCQVGHSNLCENIAVPGKTYSPGGYAELVAVPMADRNLVRLPDEISFPDAAILGCRFMTAFHGVVDQAAVQPGEWVAVFGCGGVGLSAINTAVASGCRVIAVDINPENLAIAAKMGAAITIDSRTTDPVEAIKSATGLGAHVSVDALGIAETSGPAILSLRKRGRHLQLGVTSHLDAGYLPIPIDAIVYNEIQLIGSLGMATHRYDAMLRMISDGVLRPGLMLNREIGLGEVEGIFEMMTRQEITGTFVVTDYS